MANAARDGNGIPTLICASSADGTTTIRVQVNPTQHYIMTSDGVSGNDHGTVNAQRDGNDIPMWIGVSSADGVTPVAIYADAATGSLLTKST